MQRGKYLIDPSIPFPKQELNFKFSKEFAEAVVEAVNEHDPDKRKTLEIVEKIYCKLLDIEKRLDSLENMPNSAEYLKAKERFDENAKKEFRW